MFVITTDSFRSNAICICKGIDILLCGISEDGVLHTIEL